MPRVALSIAGSDPSGGAGIQADLKTFAAHGVHGAAALTALTAQNTRGVSGVHGVPAAFVGDQVRSVLADLRVDVIKIGMLGTAEVTALVGGLLDEHPAIPVVLDPVMVAAGGEPLLDREAVGAMRALLPRATLITPNVHEAALLLDGEPAAVPSDLGPQAARLLELGAGAVLLKGGRLRGTGPIVDVLARRGRPPEVMEHPRVPAERVHGGGCTVSSAVAARLALGEPLAGAVEGARAYVREALARGQADPVGGGATALVHGPASAGPA